MNFDHLAIFYAVSAGVMFFGPFSSDVVNFEVTKEGFARQLLGALVWPLTLMWWARPSWLWREPTPAEEQLSALHREIATLRDAATRDAARIEELEIELNSERAVQRGFR